MLKEKTFTKFLSKLDIVTLDSIEDLRCLLKQEGYALIGEGNFGKCYSKNSIDYVIKVFNQDKDIVYYTYLQDIKYLNNKYAPKIYHIESKVINDEEYCIVIMEKLIEYNVIGTNTEYDESIKKSLYSHFGFRDISQANDILDDSYTPNKDNVELNELYDIIIDIYSTTEANFDNYYGNILFRKDNIGELIPVFIDPLFQDNYLRIY